MAERLTDEQRAILQYLEKRGPLIARYIGYQFNLSTEAASSRMTRLRKRGLVWVGGGGYTLTDKARKILEEDQ